MSLFSFLPHPEHPDQLEICQNTGTLRYKLYKNREYGDTYFQEEYQAQYKKTYYEDEPNLRQLAKKRLTEFQKRISISSLPNQKLLEIGCSAGFFLDEARKLGFEVQGMELSKKEAEYAHGKLGLKVDQGSFLESEIQTEFGALALFFVLEHLENQELAWNKIKSLVAPGGVLFLAVPSFYGPLYQTQREEWFRTHPSDHHFDYDPNSLKKVLTQLGFEAVFLQPMSYHPKRDHGFRGFLPHWLYRQLADFSSYGDTLQILARKKANS